MLQLLASSVAAPTPPHPLNRRAIPGSYGWPLIGPISDRLQYFWFQGPNDFFKSRIETYRSTVFRTNVPPAFPFFGNVNPNVVALLDVKSFSHLFDMEIVEKGNVLVGDFMPSVEFTGGERVCAYLDTSESKHSQVKNLALDILKRSSKRWLPSLKTSLDTMFDDLESNLNKNGNGNGASYITPLQKFLFAFLSKTLLNANTSASPEIEKNGYFMVDKWLALQLLPTVPINILQPLEEIFLHSFTYPSWLVKSDYQKLVIWIKDQAKETVDRAQLEFGLTEEEAINNLIFILGFNAYGGFVLFLSSLISNLGAQKSVHQQLRQEVRDKLEQDQELSFEAVKDMELINSFVYETLRLNPPVPSQFGRARKTFDLTSHDSVFTINKGELLCGYQPLVMRDSKVFDAPDDFEYDRFTNSKGGEELLKYLFWSNGPQKGTNGPSAENKQCPGRDFVPMTAALILVYLFQRYDEVEISSGSFISLKKAKH